MGANLKSLFATNKAGLWIFFAVALVATILLVIFVAPFASRSPDGLEKVVRSNAASPGVNKAQGARPADKGAPFPNYGVNGVKNEKASTVFSGLIGVFITAGIIVVLALTIVFLKSFRKSHTPPHEA